MQLKVWTDDMELSDDPFKPIFEVLDKFFQHKEEVELPECCQEFFEKFNREREENSRLTWSVIRPCGGS